MILSKIKMVTNKTYIHCGDCEGWNTPMYIEQHFNFYSCDCYLLPQLSNISRESFGCVGGHDCHQRFFFQHKLASCKAPSTSIIITSIWRRALRTRSQGRVTNMMSPRKKASATPFYWPLLPNSEREVFLIRSMMKYAIEKYLYLYNSACAMIDKYLLSTDLHSSLCSERCSFWHCALQ